MSDLDVIREAVEHDLEPSIAELIGPSSAALYARTRAAARRFLALTETGRQVDYCETHESIDIEWEYPGPKHCLNGEDHIGESEVEDGWDCVVVSKYLVNDPRG